MTYTSTPFNLGTKVQGNAKVTYKSSNPKVLTVSSKGKVTLKGIGKATITIKTKQNAKYAAGTKKIVITVKAPKVKLLKCTALSDCRVKLTWSAYSAFDGYEIQFSRDSKFSDGYEPIDFNKKSGSAILRGGAEGRTYYARIRPYSKVNGKKVTYAWSNVGTFKTFK
ncbi:MAG: Ig-like domain-containing protein [Eubacterium sp.]|nr:Ig-like domain-containing protein [Eubacterium sp.]